MITRENPLAGAMRAVESKADIWKAIEKWKKAFLAVGRTDHGFADDLIWVENLGIWLNINGWEKSGGFRYWNGLGDRLGNLSDRNLIVEVNPPDGGLPGRWQGLVAKDAAGNTVLLHAGELNVRGSRVQLREELERGLLPSAAVRFSDGSVREYYVVTLLDQPHDNITRDTKRFLNACAAVRSLGLSQSRDFIIAQTKASDFEESIGTTIVPAQPQKEIDRRHARIWRDLRDALRREGFEVEYDRISALGPDMYTTCAGNPYLFEIKTSSSASDCLKGVGQLIVYERLLKRVYKKYLVLPQDVGKTFIPVLRELQIGVMFYDFRANRATFTWPADFAH